MLWMIVVIESEITIAKAMPKGPIEDLLNSP